MPPTNKIHPKPCVGTWDKKAVVEYVKDKVAEQAQEVFTKEYHMDFQPPVFHLDYEATIPHFVTTTPPDWLPSKVVNTGYSQDVKLSTAAKMNPDALAYAATAEAKNIEIRIKNYGKLLNAYVTKKLTEVTTEGETKLLLNKVGQARLELIAAMVELEDVLLTFYGSEYENTSKAKL